MTLNDDLEWQTRRNSTPLAVGIQTAELPSFRGVEKTGRLLVMLSLQSFLVIAKRTSTTMLSSSAVNPSITSSETKPHKTLAYVQERLATLGAIGSHFPDLSLNTVGDFTRYVQHALLCC